MGPGISSYFKLLKAFAWLFLLWTLFTLPMDVMVTFGTRNTTLPEATAFAEVTLGQLGADPNVTNVEVVGTDCAPEGQPSRPCLVTKLEAAQVFTISDLISMAIWCVAYVWIRVMEKRESQAIDMDHMTIQDYSVHLTSVPPFAKADHIRKHFEAITGEGSVADVQVAEDDAELLRIFVKRGRLIKRITDLTEQQAKAHAMGRHGLEKRLLSRRTAIKEKIMLLNGQARSVKTNNRSLAAFVTFERHADMSRVTRMYRSRGACSAFLQPHRLRMSVPDPTQRSKGRLAAAAKAAFGGGSAAPEPRPADEAALPEVSVRVRVKAAPPPSTIMWHNLHFSWCSRMQRRSVTAVVSAVLLVLSVLAGVLASVQQAQLANASGGGTCASTSSAAVLKKAATGPEATTEDVYCYCQYLGKHDAVAFAKEGRLCADWASSVLITTIATVAAAAVVPVVNGVFRILLKYMSEWEAHHSLNSQAESFAQRLFLLTVINTSILPLLINARIPGLVLPGNQFEDLVPVWYATVGVQITLTMLINVFVPHVTPILRFFYVLAVQRGFCHERGCSFKCLGDPSQRAVSQRQLDSWFEGPQFHLDTRYATIMQSVFVTLLFGAVLPLLVPIAFFGMLLSFYVDKWLLLRFYRIPPHYDVHLGRALTSWIPWAIFLHLGFTAYAMSTPAIFASVAADVGVFGDVTSAAAASSGTLRELVQRLQQTHVFSLTVAALAVLLFTVLSKFVSGLTRCSRVACAVVSCGACVERPKDRLSLACANTTFSEARDSGRLSGLVSYSLMQNPDIADAMAIAPEVAKSKKRVIEFRDELPTCDTKAAAAAVAAGEAAAAAGGIGVTDSKSAPLATAASASAIASAEDGPLLATAAAAGHKDHEELVMVERRLAPPPRPAVETANPAFGAGVTGEDATGFRGADTPRTRLGHRRPGEGGESRGTFTGVRRRVFGSDTGADDEWTDAAPGRRLRREEAEAEAREAMVLGRDVSLRMLAAWRRGEDSAAAAHAATLGARYVQTDLDDSDGDSSSGADSAADAWAGGHGSSAGLAGVGGASGMVVTPVAALPNSKSSRLFGASAPSAATPSSGMVITPVGMPAGVPRPLGPAHAAAAGASGAFDFDLDEEDSDSSEEEVRVMHRAGIPTNDWDVDENQPVRWTGYGGVIQPHADADAGERDA